MAQYAVYLCDPGASMARERYTPEELVQKCKCKHPRHAHWWGGGSCGDCDRCDYFDARSSRAPVPSSPEPTEEQK